VRKTEAKPKTSRKSQSQKAITEKKEPLHNRNRLYCTHCREQEFFWYGEEARDDSDHEKSVSASRCNHKAFADYEGADEDLSPPENNRGLLADGRVGTYALWNHYGWLLVYRITHPAAKVHVDRSFHGVPIDSIDLPLDQARAHYAVQLDRGHFIPAGVLMPETQELPE
jgi:hypothetical protein